jgi:hypothetical protein
MSGQQPKVRVSERAKDKRNKVIDICDNGEVMAVQFVRDDGSIAIGLYKHFGWKLLPPDLAEEWHKKITAAPKFFHRSR